MLHRHKGCLDGQHIPVLRKRAADSGHGHPPGERSRCRRCGHPLVKSPITRKWCLTGLLG